MDRIDRIGPRPASQWLPAIDPDREDVARRRREQERRRREAERRRDEAPPRDDDDGVPHVDVRA